MRRYHGAHLEEEEGPLIMAVAAGALFNILAKCGEDPLIMAVAAAGDHGGGGGGLSYPV